MDNARLSRRGLIGASAGLAASATLFGSSTAADGAVGDGDFVSLLPVDRIGLQLYSVRDTISRDGFEKTLAKMAEIGFKQVEFAGYTQGTGAITVQQLRDLLDKYGLKGAGSHISPSSDASMTKILDDAEVLGLPQVGLASVQSSQGVPTTDGWKTQADLANHYGEMAVKRGMRYYLHNHQQEWVPCVDDPSKCGHDVLLENVDPRFAFFQLDIYWCYVGQAQIQNTRPFDPLADYILKHHDRYLTFHVKDGIYDSRPNAKMSDVGVGKIDFQTIFTELFKKSAPDRHIYLWENDEASSHPRGSLASAQLSYSSMRYSLKKAAA